MGKHVGQFLYNECEWLAYNEKNLKDVPKRRGMYLLSCPKGDVIYVGKAKNLKGRLLTYEKPNCHNKWIRTYNEGKQLALDNGCIPLNLYFMFRCTNHPSNAEAVAIQYYATAIRKFNQRNEWKPLGDPADEAYKLIIENIIKNLDEEQRKKFEYWLQRNQRQNLHS